MIHNVIVVSGVEYKAVREASMDNRCHGCVADSYAVLCGLIHPCGANSREDHEDVRYKRHYKLKHNG